MREGRLIPYPGFDTLAKLCCPSDMRKPHHKVHFLLIFLIVLLGCLSSSPAVFVVLVREACSLYYSKRMFKIA